MQPPACEPAQTSLLGQERSHDSVTPVSPGDNESMARNVSEAIIDSPAPSEPTANAWVRPAQISGIIILYY